MAPIEELAPAKVNLTLHVTGRREDGYHLLDSLVVFADVGDLVTVREADEPGFTVTGPQAGHVPVDASNLVLRAAALFSDARAEIRLDKHLPAASGIGGGSADAAATLRALCRLRGSPLPTAEQVLALGADVPACLTGRAVRLRGIGERLDPVPVLPPLPAVLVNPGVAVSTPAVFARLAQRENPSMPDLPVSFNDAGALALWLAAQRNDLEPPACALAPVIGDVLARLRAVPDCLLARMSGSGATCFGLFPDADAAERAAAALVAVRPEWWVVPCTLA